MYFCFRLFWTLPKKVDFRQKHNILKLVGTFLVGFIVLGPRAGKPSGYADLHGKGKKTGNK